MRSVIFSARVYAANPKGFRRILRLWPTQGLGRVVYVPTCGRGRLGAEMAHPPRACVPTTPRRTAGEVQQHSNAARVGVCGAATGPGSASGVALWAGQSAASAASATAPIFYRICI